MNKKMMLAGIIIAIIACTACSGPGKAEAAEPEEEPMIYINPWPEYDELVADAPSDRSGYMEIKEMDIEYEADIPEDNTYVAIIIDKDDYKKLGDVPPITEYNIEYNVDESLQEKYEELENVQKGVILGKIVDADLARVYVSIVDIVDVEY